MKPIKIDGVVYSWVDGHGYYDENMQYLGYHEICKAVSEGKVQNPVERPVIRCSKTKELVLYRNAEKAWVYDDDGSIATPQCVRAALNNVVDGEYELGVDFV